MGMSFDEGMVQAMSEYLIAVNRLKHAQSRPAALDDPTMLRRLAAEEVEAEAACVAALERHGWVPPYRALRVGA